MTLSLRLALSDGEPGFPLDRGELLITDLSSANGTRLDGVTLPVNEPTPWRVGQRVRLGATRLRLDVEQDGRDHPEDGTGHLTPARHVTPPREAPSVVTWPADAATPPRTPLRWAAVLVPIPVALIMAYFLHSMLMLALWCAARPSCC